MNKFDESKNREIKINFGPTHNLQSHQEILAGGFVHNIRDHGGLLFIDLRSESALLQCVINPEISPSAFEIAEKLKPESVISVSGTIQNRSSETINPNLATGQIELLANHIEVIAPAKALPFDIHGNNNLANEDLRFQYRYLDLRREKLQNILRARHKLILDIRNYFSDQDFIEVQTPILANPSPEGARDYVVPSRLHPGQFYALPQAPQQFKQMLMVGGFNKYFQIAPCFRDEDPRSDRAIGDFYQIDAEIAWATQADIFEINNQFIKAVVAKHSQKELDPKIEYLKYDDAMNQYGSDKPDLRYALPWQDVKSIFKNSNFKVFADLCENKNARVQALVIKGGCNEFTRSDLDKIQDIGRQNGLPGIAYIQFYSEGPKSPIFKFFGDEEQQNLKIQEITTTLKVETNDLVLFIANPDKNIVFKAQNQMRQFVAKHLDLINPNILKFAWIYDFPFFERDEKTHKLDFAHNPFGVWQENEGQSKLESILQATQNQTLEELKAIQYDLTLNGYEVLSGGVRNSNHETLLIAFETVGYTQEEVKRKFNHMLEAYQYGAPPHAGFAWGFDRLFMILQDEPNIREIFAFPKNGSGIDLMSKSPSNLTNLQLKELGLKTVE